MWKSLIMKDYPYSLSVGYIFLPLSLSLSRFGRSRLKIKVFEDWANQQNPGSIVSQHLELGEILRGTHVRLSG